MPEEKKRNGPQDAELKDNELDKVAGGVGDLIRRADSGEICLTAETPFFRDLGDSVPAKTLPAGTAVITTGVSAVPGNSRVSSDYGVFAQISSPDRGYIERS